MRKYFYHNSNASLISHTVFSSIIMNFESAKSSDIICLPFQMQQLQLTRMLACSLFVSMIIASLLTGPSSGLVLGHSLNKRSFFEIQCKGVYDKSIFARLDRICEDCYNLFREPQLHSLCRYTDPLFCLYFNQVNIWVPLKEECVCVSLSRLVTFALGPCISIWWSAE